jgi:hypothetical protein
MFRAIGDQPSLGESLLPDEGLQLPEELARVDALLDDPVFFAPFARYFDPALAENLIRAGLSGVPVLVEDAAEAVVSPDVKVGGGGQFRDR